MTYPCSNVFPSGVLTSKGYIRWYRRSPLGQLFLSHRTAHFDVWCFQAVKDVNASQGTLIELFSRIEYFFRRLEIYIGVPPTAAMTEITTEIMAEVLIIIGMATKEVKRGRMSELIFALFYVC